MKKDLRKCLRVNKRYRELLRMHGSYSDYPSNAKELFLLGLVYEDDLDDKEKEDIKELRKDLKFMQERVNVYIEDNFINFANKKYIENNIKSPFSKMAMHYILIGISLKINKMINKVSDNKMNSYYNLIEKIRKGDITYENYKSNND